MKLSIPQIPHWAIITIQILFFILIILPAIITLPFFIAPIFIALEIGIIATNILKIKKKKKIFYLLWEIQFFLYILFLILLKPNETLNVQDISTTAILFFTLVLIGIETLFLFYFIFKEKAIKKILFVLASSTTIIVFLIVFFVMSEGIPAFQETGPVELITGTEWDPYYNEPFSESVTLTTPVEPSDFSISTDVNPLYIPSNEYRNITVTIENNGGSKDLYTLSIDTRLDYNLHEKNISVGSDSLKKVNISIKSPDENQEILKIFVESQYYQKSKNLSINCIKSDYGVLIYPKHKSFLLKLEKEKINVNFQITNLATNKETFILKSTSIEKFRPIIKNIETENFNEQIQNNQIIKTWEIKLNPLETKKFTFRPNFVYGKIDGEYTIDLSIKSKQHPNIYTNANLTVVYSENLVVTVKDPSQKISSTETAVYQINIDKGGLPKNQLSIRNKLIKGEAIIKTYYNDVLITDDTDPSNLIISEQNGSIINVSVTPLASNEGTIITEFIVDVPGDKPEIGALPFIILTIITTLLAVLIAAPLGVGVAILLAEFTPSKLRKILRPIYELLAGIPSVLYGLWGFYAFGPLLSENVYPIIADTLGQHIEFFSYSSNMGRGVFTASVVLSIMIIPIIITLSEDAIHSVSRSLKEGSLAMGATRWQTMRKIIIPRAKSGVVSSIILGTGRAIGETMAVLMIMGVTVRIPETVFDSGVTMTGVIAAFFECTFNDPITRHSLFAIGTILFVMVFVLNIIIAYIQKKTSEEIKGENKKSIFQKIFKSKFNNTPNKIETNEYEKEYEDETESFEVLSVEKPDEYILLNEDKEENIQKNKHYDFSDEDDEKIKKLFSKKRFRSLKQAQYFEKIITIILILCGVLVSFFILYILADIIINGGLSLHLDFFTQREIAGGKEGGFLNAIVGSLYLVGFGIAIAAPLSIGAAIYVQEYAKKDNILTRIILFTSDTLASTPSIIFGAFGFMLFVLYLGFGYSLIAGGITLAFMVIPLMLRSSIEALKAIPREFQEGSLALGATKWQSIRTVILPPATAAIISGVIISMGRAIGETAAVLLTANYAQSIPTSIMDSAGSMPILIYYYYDEALRVPILGEKVYSAAFILILMVLILNAVARIIGYRSSRLMKR